MLANDTFKTDRYDVIIEVKTYNKKMFDFYNPRQKVKINKTGCTVD